MTDVVIASAAWTAIGNFNGAFACTPAYDRRATAIKAAVERAGIDADDGGMGMAFCIERDCFS